MFKAYVMRKRGEHSGIYLLPNLLTTASLFAAFYSIVSSLKGQYEAAAIAIFIGMITDGLDGRIARMTNTQSAFGAEYDSLSDMVSFGVAPALLLYSWSLQQLGKFGWMIAFVYTAAVGLRLARFNTQLETADKRYFQGLPCPPAAAVLGAFSWLCASRDLPNLPIAIVAAILVGTMAILMVSNIRYLSFKELDFKGKIPFLHVSLIVILFAAIAINPSLVLFIGFSSYACSGPLQTLWAIERVRKQRRQVARERTQK